MAAEVKSPCESCQQTCPTKGCVLWRNWFINHWNKYICRAVVLPREAWQYEHPDMVREGIEWKS